MKIRCADGRVRKAEKIICKECKKEHLVRIRPNRKRKVEFCSIVCFREFSKKETKTKLNCSWCKKEFFRTSSKIRNSKSGLYFCCRKCKDEAQRLGGIKDIQPNHYGTSNKIDYRQIYIDAGKELICGRCGYKEFESSVQIHHIDENRNNNTIENLLALCANCHYALHNKCWKFG